MINRILNLGLILVFLLSSCSEESSLETSGSSSGGGNSASQNQPGVITAAEWNDLDNWSFWENTISTGDYQLIPDYWTIFNNNRVAVIVASADGSPIVNALVKLKRDSTTIFTARTDNKGKAELWIDLFQRNTKPDFSNFSIDVNNGASVISPVRAYKEGINNVVLPSTAINNEIEISFVVDATGSMGDELEFLKTELLDVIARIKNSNPNASVLTSSIFYRDEGDDYVTKVSNFTPDNSETVNFIKRQSAGGGGDFPEAVHTALDKATNQLQWSINSKTRIMFLILDAPPHEDNLVISSLQSSLLKAAKKGVKIIPITASGIDKKTEFLMRFLAITTNGTYVFITNDSGVGNDHLEASVGEYQVELLNDLMVRLINKYAE